MRRWHGDSGDTGELQPRSRDVRHGGFALRNPFGCTTDSTLSRPPWHVRCRRSAGIARLVADLVYQQ
jgi:hypothetical protein